MILTIIILATTIILCIVVVSISYVLQGLLKDHYMLRGEMAMLTMLMDYSSQVPAQTYSFVVPEEEVPTTSFEVNMEGEQPLPAST